MDCHYCGEPAGYHLDEIEGDETIPRSACYHCFQLLKGVPQEHRKAQIIDVLQKHHSTALKMADNSEYKKYWLAKLAERLSWAHVGFRILAPKSAVAELKSTEVKSVTPKPIKIKKLG